MKSVETRQFVLMITARLSLPGTRCDRLTQGLSTFGYDLIVYWLSVKQSRAASYKSELKMCPKREETPDRKSRASALEVNSINLYRLNYKILRSKYICKLNQAYTFLYIEHKYIQRIFPWHFNDCLISDVFLVVTYKARTRTMIVFIRYPASFKSRTAVSISEDFALF